MLPELGHFCIILALCLALLQTGYFVSSLCLRNSPLSNINVFSPLALGQVFFVWLATLILCWAFVSDDFSVLYIANNSNSSLPMYFKLTALWGAHEGSLLLWIVILCAWMFGAVLASRTWVASLRAAVLSVMSLINTGFLLLLLKTSNP